MVAEIARILFDAAHVAGASMGPRPIGRGNLRLAVSFSEIFLSFNGAATNWSRKFKVRTRDKDRTRELQWGRDQLVAEIELMALTDRWSQRFNGAATNWSRKC